MPSIFTKIIAGEIPSYKVAETEDFLAFLDIFPLRRGHTLVVPKVEVDRLFDLDENTYLGLMRFAKHVAAGVKTAFPCNRIGMAVIGLEVPHAHIHLVPLDEMADIDFGRPKLSLEPPEFQDIAFRISDHLRYD
ncbi:MAG: HIT family protein [Bacteroidota bacterium]